MRNASGALIAAILLALAIGAGPPVAPAAEKPGDLQSTEDLARRVRESARKRIRNMDQRRLQETRQFLGVESDRQWAALSPKIKRVIQLRRLRDRLRTGGSPATAVSVPAPLSEAPELAARLALWSPDVRAQWLEELASARATLGNAFQNPNSDDERMNDALNAWKQARGNLETKLNAAIDALREVASARQKAGLTLLGILP